MDNKTNIKFYTYCGIQSIIFVLIFAFSNTTLPLLVLNGIFHACLGMIGLLDSIYNKLRNKSVDKTVSGYDEDIEHANPNNYPYKYDITFSVLCDGLPNEQGYINHEHISSEITLYGNSKEEILEFIKRKSSLEIQEFKVVPSENTKRNVLKDKIELDTIVLGE